MKQSLQTDVGVATSRDRLTQMRGVKAEVDCVPGCGVTPLRVMLCVVHYAVRAWVVSITPVWSGRGVRAVGSDGVSMAMEVSDR